MKEVLKYICDNKQWIFSGVGGLILLEIIYLLKPFFKNNELVNKVELDQNKEPLLKSLPTENEIVRPNSEKPKQEYEISTYSDGETVINIVTGEIEVQPNTWNAKIDLPLFKEIPEISLNRKGGGLGIVPNIDEKSNSSFTISITSTDQAGIWIWKATGVLLKNKYKDES